MNLNLCTAKEHAIGNRDLEGSRNLINTITAVHARSVVACVTTLPQLTLIAVSGGLLRVFG